MLNKRLTLVLAALCLAACNNEPKPAASVSKTENSDVNIPAIIPYDIVNEYPHDPTAFTEGLEYKDGILFESTGEYGSSDIRKTDIKTGKVISSTKMDAKYFGEGLTILNGKIYQLTYREGKGFVYDLATLKKESTFSFTANEGWGMTNNGAQLIFDDGSNVLHFVDPSSFREVKRLAVTDEHGPVNEINEPELIHGFIYANLWRTELILKIDTTTGRVVGRADLGTLRQRAGISSSNSRLSPDVLNGIAYDAVNNRIFITGKNWPKLFEIKLDN
jgi:glutamine cyclotransferase